MENKDETFSFSYSAEQQEEVKRIREKYAPRQADKMERLRQLDRSASRKARVWAMIIGILGALILGTGMSLSMSDFAEVLGSHRDSAMLIGIIIGLIGLVLVALAYPVYNRILKKERQRIAPEILRLTDELMQ